MSDKVKSAIIGTVGIPANYGGFETIVDELALRYQGERKVYVYCSSKSYEQRITKYGKFTLVYLPIRANGIWSIFYDIIIIIHAVFILKVNNLLILGVSGCLILPFIKIIRPSIKVTTNIDGLEWKRQKWKWYAKLFLKMSEYLACRFSDNLISDNLHIGSHIWTSYGRASTLLSCGGEHAVKGVEIDLKDIPDEYFLKICRVEPENNVGMVLEAFSKLGEKNIVLVGNWNHSSYAKDLKEKYRKYANIFLVGPTYDKNVIYTLRKNCLAYVHGHSAGGTNPSLVEILL